MEILKQLGEEFSQDSAIISAAKKVRPDMSDTDISAKLSTLSLSELQKEVDKLQEEYDGIIDSEAKLADLLRSNSALLTDGVMIGVNENIETKKNILEKLKSYNILLDFLKSKINTTNNNIKIKQQELASILHIEDILKQKDFTDNYPNTITQKEQIDAISEPLLTPLLEAREKNTKQAFETYKSTRQTELDAQSQAIQNLIDGFGQLLDQISDFLTRVKNVLSQGDVTAEVRKEFTPQVVKAVEEAEDGNGDNVGDIGEAEATDKKFTRDTTKATLDVVNSRVVELDQNNLHIEKLRESLIGLAGESGETELGDLLISFDAGILTIILSKHSHKKKIPDIFELQPHTKIIGSKTTQEFLKTLMGIYVDKTYVLSLKKDISSENKYTWKSILTEFTEQVNYNVKKTVSGKNELSKIDIYTLLTMFCKLCNIGLVINDEIYNQKVEDENISKGTEVILGAAAEDINTQLANSPVINLIKEKKPNFDISSISDALKPKFLSLESFDGEAYKWMMENVCGIANFSTTFAEDFDKWKKTIHQNNRQSQIHDFDPRLKSVVANSLSINDNRSSLLVGETPKEGGPNHYPKLEKSLGGWSFVGTNQLINS